MLNPDQAQIAISKACHILAKHTTPYRLEFDTFPEQGEGVCTIGVRDAGRNVTRELLKWSTEEEGRRFIVEGAVILEVTWRFETTLESLLRAIS